MSITEDLINFDIIETHKENIQSLPGGRSAKALASHFAPTSQRSSGGPTPGDTRNLNDAIREEYELELIAIGDSDDPLDIYDRYVKWTLGAYPSAQATPDSQLRSLLERATKAFQSASHYKNDPRYLKLWLSYIRFFSDSPRETFAYLARHNIGEGLALFYEEFAAWLESAGRWNQADEVYKLGIEREARPAERLIRKFAEFQHRFEARVQNGDEPSSPALPTVRPALVAKIDPFAITTPRPADPQAPRPSSGIGGSSTSRGGRQKLAIFSDTDAPTSSLKAATGDGPRGWDNIGTIAERKKENVMEARPWAGETLKTGKKASGAPKMPIFKDESSSQIPNTYSLGNSRYADQQQITNPRTGKIERVFVNLEAVYPNDNGLNEEMSFEELRAKARGWLNRDWAAESKQRIAAKANGCAEEMRTATGATELEAAADDARVAQTQSDAHSSPQTQPFDNTIPIDIGQDGKTGRSKKTKIKEVKGATQTIKTNLESPTGPKLRRKNSAEPTMTLHTKAATDDILDIFNQPLRNVDPMSGLGESDGETEYDDDDYTSGGESTGTGRISGTSEFGDTEADFKTGVDTVATGAGSVSPWSDFTASKHVPKLDKDEEDENETNETDSQAFEVLVDSAPTEDEKDNDLIVVTPISPDVEAENELPRPRYIPLPPEDYEPPVRFPRNPSQVAQNRLPFMTPIVEKTESSMGALTIKDEDYFTSKTPSRNAGKGRATPEINEELLSSPFQEIVNEARPPRAPKLKIVKGNADLDSAKDAKGPIIKDAQCNPVDDSIRNNILENMQPPLSSYAGYHDYRPITCNKAPEIRKFIKALQRTKTGSDKTTTCLSIPPTLHFTASPSETYTIKRELGKGAFAPVYLASSESADTSLSSLIPSQFAVKCEDPPTPWEFYIMSILQSRLSQHSKHPSTLPSLCSPYALHLFTDEAYLFETYLDQGTLLDLVNLVKSDPTSGQTTLDESVAMFFTIELLRTVESLHSVGILHGDLKADNCLVRLPNTPDHSWDSTYDPSGQHGWSAKGLCLIDFGRGIDLNHFRPDVQFVADWKTGKQDCVEMREMRPWYWQVDYWGIAGVVHSLLFGKYIEDTVVEKKKDDEDEEERGGGPIVGAKRFKIREPLKRYWQLELWARLFDVLLNPGSHVQAEVAGKMPCVRGLRAVREGMEAWLGGGGGRRNGGLKAGLRRLEERTRERRGR